MSAVVDPPRHQRFLRPTLVAFVPVAAVAATALTVAALAVGPWRLILPLLLVAVVLAFRPRPTTAVGLALVAVPLTALLRRLTAGPSAWLPGDPLAVLVVVAALPAFALLKGRARTAPGSGWLAAYLAWLGLTALTATSGSVATRVTGLLLIAVPCGIGYLAARGWAPDASRTALRSVLVLVLPVSLYGVLQFFLAPSWDLAWLRSVASTLTSVGRPEARGFRVWGTMESPLSFALYLGVGVIGVLAWVVSRRGTPRGGARVLFATVVLLSSMTALVLTGVRSVLFILPVLLLVAAVLKLLPVGRWQAVLLAVGVAAATYLGTSVLGLTAAGSSNDRYDLNGLGSDQSVLDRLQLLPRFIAAAVNPVGVGPGGAGVASSLSEGGSSNGVDNGFLSLVVEGGLVRLVLFLLVAVTALVAAVRSARRDPRDPVTLFSVLVIVYYLGLEVSSDVSSGAGSLIFWICVGGAFGRAAQDAVVPPARTRAAVAPRPAAPTAPRPEPAWIPATPAAAPSGPVDLAPAVGIGVALADVAPAGTAPAGTAPAGTAPAGTAPAGTAPAAPGPAPSTPPVVPGGGVPDAPEPGGDDAQEHRSSQGRSLKSVLHVALAAGVLPLVSLATGPLLARTLGLEDRGHLSAVLAPVALVPYVLSIGLGDGAAYLVARRRRRPEDVALVLGLLGGLSGAVGAALIWVLAPVLLEDFPSGVGLLRTLGLTLIPAMALSNVQSARTGEGRYDLLARERWVAGLSRLFGLVGLALAGALTVSTGAWAQTLLLVMAQCMALVGLKLPRTAWREAREIASTGTRYGIRAWGGELSVFVILRLDQTVMMPIAGASQLGLYVVAVSLAEVPILLLGDLRRLLLAEVAATRDAALAARACRLALVAVSIPVAGAICLTPLMIPLLFGQDFRGAVPMAIVLLIASLFSGLNLFLGGSISALGRPEAQSRAQVYSLVVAVLGIGLIWPLGGMGAAITSLLAYVTSSLVMTVVFHRLTGISYASFLVPQREDVAALRRTVLKRLGRSA